MHAISVWFWLAICILLQIFIPCSMSGGGTEWSPFCEEELFFKPYVRIMEGRNGPMIQESGPGFIELSDMENLYVCANGLVFLYFKIVRMYGEVYDDAVMQYASHYCGFFNGKMGPGIEERNVTLYAILLIGHSKDYRKIAVQMFTAPWFNTSTGSPMNYTSLAIINSGGECILRKGNEKANIRIKGNLVNGNTTQNENENSNSTAGAEEESITICRLDINILLKDPGNVPLDTELTTTEEALLALRLSDQGQLSLSGCYEYPLLDPVQFQIIQERLNESKENFSRIDQANSELNPQDGTTLKFWTTERLEKYGSPLNDIDNTTLRTEVETKNASYHEELAKPLASRDKHKLKEDKEALALAEFKLKLSLHYEKYKKLFVLAKEMGAKAEERWTEVLEAVNDETVQVTRENYTKTAMKMSEIPHEKVFSPYDRSLDQQMDEVRLLNKEYLNTLKKKTLEIGPTISKAEVTAARRKSYVMQAKKEMDKIQKFILEFERHKMAVAGLDILNSPEIVQDMLISIKNPSGGNSSGDNVACLNFEKKSEQCKAVKPSPERACQIAMHSVGGGGGGSNSSSGGDWPEGEADKWRDEVYDLIGKIFGKACPYLTGGFATSVNRIVRGYLMKKPEGTGVANNSIPGSPHIEQILQNYIANYQIKSENDTFPPLKPKDSVWDEVIEALKSCEEHVKPLKFEYASLKPFKLTSHGKDIPKMKEQADLEFAFNWAIDANFKMFATALGVCFKKLGADLAKKFYNGYSTDFLDPIRPIWLSNRDNPIFNVILGKYLVSGKGDLWTQHCMECSFEESGETEMRPLRKLWVNSYTEPNFFVDGPLKGTRGHYPLI